MNINEFMNRYGIKTKKTINKWLNNQYIDGAIFNNGWVIPNSARRPYKNYGKIKATTDANTLRCHIVKACLRREHINYVILKMTNGEFEQLINELRTYNLIQIRVEDNITYYDSTIVSQRFLDSKFNKLRKFILEFTKNVVEGVATGLVRIGGN